MVEDQPELRELLQRVLRGSGYTVLAASDGAEALTVLEARRGAVDLVLSDIIMPRAGGPEVAARLRAMNPRARILYLSGHGADASGLPPDAGGGAAVLPKPFTPDALLRKVRALLDGRPAGPASLSAMAGGAGRAPARGGGRSARRGGGNPKGGH